MSGRGRAARRAAGRLELLEGAGERTSNALEGHAHAPYGFGSSLMGMNPFDEQGEAPVRVRSIRP